MATRDSTPKYQVAHDRSGTVSVTGVSKTDAQWFARDSGPGFSVRPVRKPRMSRKSSLQQLRDDERSEAFGLAMMGGDLDCMELA